MQHEQDAVEGGLIAHCELACATFGGGSEGGDQGLQLQPQFFANGLSCHEGMKHNCFMRVSWAVVLATLRSFLVSWALQQALQEALQERSEAPKSV